MNFIKTPIRKFSRIIDNVKDDLIEYGIEYSTTKIKQYFGHEIILNKNFLKFAPDAVKSYILENFIKKYDKKFDNHFEVNCFDRVDLIKTYTLKGTRLIIPICMNHETIPDTFIYIAYGNIYKNPLEQYIISPQNISLNDMYIYLFGSGSHRLMKEFKQNVEECYKTIREEDEHDRELAFFSCTFDPNSKNKDSIDALYVTKTMVIRKNIDDLVYSHNEKDKIINHLDKWITQESFCKKKGLMYKTGILLYGDPGTGKSSLANAIASKYHRSIISIDVNKIIDMPLNELAKSISCDENRYIVLFEDLDVIMLDRENDETKQKGKEIINKMLQFLDSNTSPKNVIFIGTTNYYNRLDPALIRDGRFDLKVEVKGVKDNEAKKLCKEFDLDNKYIDEVINDYYTEHPDDKLINQSALQNIILRKMDMMLIDSEQENASV